MRRFRLLLAPVVVMVAFAIAAPAQAHEFSIFQDSPYTTGWAHISDGHFKIYVCDSNVDGRRVRAWYWMYGGRTNYYITGWAPSQGCTSTIGTHYAMQEVRVCTEEVGCTSWRDA